MRSQMCCDGCGRPIGKRHLVVQLLGPQGDGGARRIFAVAHLRCIPQAVELASRKLLEHAASAALVQMARRLALQAAPHRQSGAAKQPAKEDEP